MVGGFKSDGQEKGRQGSRGQKAILSDRRFKNWKAIIELVVESRLLNEGQQSKTPVVTLDHVRFHRPCCRTGAGR